MTQSTPSRCRPRELLREIDAGFDDLGAYAPLRRKAGLIADFARDATEVLT
jgi:hypothetical protein